MREYYIEGQLQVDCKHLRRYVLSHPPYGFLTLRGQTTRSCEIPINVESAAITHKSTNSVVLTKELTEIVDYLNALDNTTIEGNVLFWYRNATGQAVHKFEEKNRYIKFLFDIPEPQKEMSIAELRRSFTTVRCRLVFNKRRLTRYVTEIGLNGFRSRFAQRTTIAIRGKDVQLIPIDGETSDSQSLASSQASDSESLASSQQDE